MINENQIITINGNLGFTEKLREYSMNPVWKDYNTLWAFVSGCSEGLGNIIYRDIANYVQNIRDIDTCGLHQLYSIGKELQVEQIFSYDLAYPPDLEELMNNLSINRSFVLVSGYTMDNSTLAAITADISLTSGYTVTIGTSAISGLVIWDENYITGFIEPVLSAHLIKNSTYSIDDPIYSGTALMYQGFMDDIYSDPQSEFNATTSGIIIEECTHTLRNILFRASYQRETLKTIAQKHAMIGTNKSLEKLIREYLLRTFTKKEDWRLYVEPSGTLKANSINDAYAYEQQLPSIYDINNFDVRVVEYYDRTEYLNLSSSSPLLCGITGFTSAQMTSSWIDISGNLCSAYYIENDIPVYAQGLCGYVVTGGNQRFWEQDLLDTALASKYSNDMAAASAAVSAFYDSVINTIYSENSTEAVSMTLADMWDLQTYLWNLHAVSGFNYFSEIPELTGTFTDAYSAVPLSAAYSVPTSGWSELPTFLSGMHWKYIGLTSGYIKNVTGSITGDILGAEEPAANWKNQIYPTIAPQPFIWNLVEKVYEDYPDILNTLLFTELSDTEMLSSRIDTSGNLIDSWKYFNQEFIGYQTAYEEHNNLDFNENMNLRVDKDGPFDIDALTAYINTSDTNILTLSSYYAHIGKTFALSAYNPSIVEQLTAFRDDMMELSGKIIYQYQIDQNENHYMLYKDSDNLEAYGTLWMRYRNHPLPFPLSYGVEDDWNKQQLYLYGGIDGLGTVVNGQCYDFGFIGDIMWIFGRDTLGNDNIWVLTCSNVTFPFSTTGPSDVTVYSMNIENMTPCPDANIGKENFIGVYSHNSYIIFVYFISMTSTGTAQFKFKHYNKYNKRWEETIYEDVYIAGLKDRYTTVENIWRLAVSENWVHIAYESINTNDNNYVNSITTIDINKNTLSDVPGNYVVHEWYNIVDNL